MTADNPDVFKGLQSGDLVFRTNRDRCIYLRLYEWQKNKWLEDHPELWKTREDALRDLQCRLGSDIEADPAEPRSLTSTTKVRTGDESDGSLSALCDDRRLPHKPTTHANSLTIATAEAAAPAGDEIAVGEQRFVSERRVAAMLGYSQRQLQRLRKEQKGPPSTKVGRRVFYEFDKLQDWIERKKVSNSSPAEVGKSGSLIVALR